MPRCGWSAERQRWRNPPSPAGGRLDRCCYGCKLLVWYERYELVIDAIAREKQIKGGSRRRKLALIEAMNPLWRDLYEDLAR